MIKLREKILSKFLLLLLIAGVCTFNFSYNTTIALCDDEAGEETCCTTECTDAHTSDNDFSQNDFAETISGDCLCIVELPGENIFGERSLINTPSNTNNTHQHSHNINFIKTVDFAEANIVKCSNIFIKPPGNSSYILKDIYLFNSILRI